MTADKKDIKKGLEDAKKLEEKHEPTVEEIEEEGKDFDKEEKKAKKFLKENL